MSLPLYSRGKSLRFPLDRLGEPQNRSARCEEVTILFPTGIQTPTPRSFRSPLGRYPHRRTGVSFTSRIFRCTFFTKTRGVNETPVLWFECEPNGPWNALECRVKTPRRVEHALHSSPHMIFAHCLQLYCHVPCICSRDLFSFKILKRWIIQTFYRIPLTRQRPNARPVPT
jgi:hypothetical protein